MKHEFYRKMIAVLAAATILLAELPAQLTASGEGETDVTDFTGYKAISTKEELNAVRNDLAGKYYLTQDIVFTYEDFAEGGVLYNNGEGWEPIGTTPENAFTGIFNGDGHTITGLYVNIKSLDSVYAGIFGYNMGTIRNLNIVNESVDVTASPEDWLNSKDYYCVGGIAGENDNIGIIINCYFMGCIITYKNIGTHVICSGGIAGINNGAIIKCYNVGSINSYSSFYVNAIAETADNSYNINEISLTGTYAGGISEYEGSLTGTYAGGISGYNDGVINNCYNTGFIESSYNYTGGIAGGNSDTITDCYNLGSVSTSSTEIYTGGIVGYSESKAGITNCYYINNITKGVGTGTDTAVSCTDEQLKQKETFVGFNFGTVWTIGDDQEYPYPQLLETLYGDIDNNGEVTAADALLALQASVGKTTLAAEQTVFADVDCSGKVTANDALLILQYSVGKIKSFPDK